ncbi:MAG TPA: YraN family protein [Candidatus Paceibacterota bacterium]
MSQTDKQNIGKIGENEAEKFLKRQFYRIIERNYWKKWGEIDIVADKDEIIHFIEVKTVSREIVPEEESDNYSPEDNIHPWKRKRLSRVIETYLLDRRIDENRDWQVDALAVYLNGEGKVLKVDHLEDIIL